MDSGGLVLFFLVVRSLHEGQDISVMEQGLRLMALRRPHQLIKSDWTGKDCQKTL